MTAQLYNDAILAEAKARHAHGRLPAPAVSVTCDNPLCGDRVTVDLDLAAGQVAAFAQTTRGCILTQAAASVLGRHLGGASSVDLQQATADIRGLLAGETVAPVWPELAMFTPVHAVKSRHECVLLPFQAAAEALAKSGG
jgi:NifU-like protein involved in Fe-S cluster formation